MFFNLMVENAYERRDRGVMLTSLELNSIWEPSKADMREPERHGQWDGYGGGADEHKYGGAGF
jgi:hypothetical protein